MYQSIVQSIIKKNFKSLSIGNYEDLLNTVSNDVIHSFLGNSAIGGQRQSKEKLRHWFERVYRLFPKLDFSVLNIIVSGFPWKTHVVVEWSANVTPIVGDTYINTGVHIIILKWGKAVKITAYENSELVAIACDKMVSAGITEAGEKQIS